MKIRVENGLAYTSNWQGARRFHSFGVYVLASAYRDHAMRIKRALWLSERYRMTQQRFDILSQYVSAMERRMAELQALSPDNLPLEHVTVSHG